MWQNYVSASHIDDVIDLLARNGEKARVIAGGTDLILELERGTRKGIDTLIDITRIPGLDQITLDENGVIHLAPLVTHNHLVASKMIRENALPLAQAAWEVGSPQIRNRGTIAGNLITASPANDTITPLIALGAQAVLRSKAGERVLPLSEFYTHVRQTVMRPDEALVDVYFPAMQGGQRGDFIKLALRRAQAISLVNIAVILTFSGNTIREAQITLGAIAPTIIHASAAEEYLAGKQLDEGVIEEAARLGMEAGRPISDVRASAAYRRKMIAVVIRRCLKAIAEGKDSISLPKDPILLRSHTPQSRYLEKSITHSGGTPIVTTINGKQYTFTTGHNKTLLRLLREEAQLIGTKEGCAEGECGACTVFLDGEAVMSCMVAAPRAHGAQIVTVEGLAKDDRLHPVQEAFIEAGAVQCGYCTPGFIMSAAKLLEERDHPSEEDIRYAITGNLCRCTGYYTIVDAIERAAAKGV